MKRREFITLLGSVAARPVVARAQQPAIPVVGYLNTRSEASDAPFTTAFRQGLKEAGFVEGENVLIEYRWAEGKFDRLPAMATDLVRQHVKLIAATGGATGVRAAMGATTTVPIVFSTAGDPVADGLVASLNRPGGNVTGVTNLTVEVAPKRLELLHELVPAAKIFALLVNPLGTNTDAQLRDLEAAAQTLGLELRVLHASSERDMDTAFANLAQMRASGLVIAADPMFNGRLQQLGALSLRYAIPAIYAYREFVAAGGLMSYGGSITDMFRLAGIYTGRILKGEKPGDLPVQRATKVELMVNLRTAKSLGLTLPPTLRAFATEVIE